MTDKVYKMCLTIARNAAANRLAYLGYYGDALSEFLTFLLSEKTLDAYLTIVASTDAAGFDPVIDRKSWTGCNLPRIEDLPLLPEALEVSAREHLDFAGCYSIDASGRIIWHGGMR